MRGAGWQGVLGRLRLGLALLCWVGAIWVIRREAAGILVALPLGALGAVLALPELLRPVTWLVDAWLGTGPGSGARPPLDLRLARHYSKAERWEEAAAEFERVLQYHPWVEEAHEELMRLAAKLGWAEEERERLYRRAMRQVKDAQAKIRLERVREETRGMGGGRASGDSLSFP